MIAYIDETQKSKFANIQFHEFDQSEPRRLNKFRVYFHPIEYMMFSWDNTSIQASGISLMMI